MFFHSQRLPGMQVSKRRTEFTPSAEEDRSSQKEATIQGNGVNNRVDWEHRLWKRDHHVYEWRERGLPAGGLAATSCLDFV